MADDFNPESVIVYAGNIFITKGEIERVGPRGLNDLLRAKADKMRASMLRGMSEEIERRGWGVVEYAENATARG